MMKKILIIDNDKDFRDMISQALSRKGYEPVLEVTGNNGLHRAVREKPDLILLDIRMPAMNGITVLKDLKGDGRTFAIPVIVVTGMASDAQIAEAFESGASSVLLKPFNLEKLYSEIERVLSSRSTPGVE